MTEHTIEPTIELRDEERTRCEVWTRVMGYHRPVSAFNLGKQAEHQERTYFQERPAGRADVAMDAGEQANQFLSQSADQRAGQTCSEATQRKAA